MVIIDTETSGCGLVGTVVRGLRKILVIIVNWFWLLVLLHKEHFDLVLLFILLNKNQMNCSGFICSVIIIRWLALVLVLVLLFKKTESNWFLPSLLVLFRFCSPALVGTSEFKYQRICSIRLFRTNVFQISDVFWQNFSYIYGLLVYLPSFPFNFCQFSKVFCVIFHHLDQFSLIYQKFVMIFRSNF